MLVIRSGGRDYLLGHLSSTLVATGQSVAAGQLVGLSGMRGAEDEDGPHLHLELQPAGAGYPRALDPATAFALAPRS